LVPFSTTRSCVLLLLTIRVHDAHLLVWLLLLLLLHLLGIWVLLILLLLDVLLHVDVPDRILALGLLELLEALVLMLLHSVLLTIAHQWLLGHWTNTHTHSVLLVGLIQLHLGRLVALLF